jgi:dATP pyrophosphohydrolase
MTTQYKRPESVLVIIHTEQGEVLLLRRKNPGDFWQSVTGSLKWDEAPDQAARRELFEETGLQPTESSELINREQTNCFPIHPEWRHRYDPEVNHNIEHVYSICLENRNSITINPDEHEEYLWLPREQAADKVSSYTNKKAILDWVSPKQDIV